MCAGIRWTGVKKRLTGGNELNPWRKVSSFEIEMDRRRYDLVLNCGHKVHHPISAMPCTEYHAKIGAPDKKRCPECGDSL